MESIVTAADSSTEVSAVVLADEPGALVSLCGITMLDRNLRVLQRLGFSSALILRATPAAKAELKKPSWARENLQLEFADEIVERGGRFLLVPGGSYYDSRLLAALVKCSRPTLAVDSSPPVDRKPLLVGAPMMGDVFVCGARLTTGEDISLSVPGAAHLPSLRFGTAGRAAATAAATAAIDFYDAFDLLDVGMLPAYIGSIRRTIHPIWFPAPATENVRLAEDLILDSATKGTCDIPAILHAPIETWIARHIFRSSITPNQITFVSSIMGVFITVEFARGHLWSGVLMSLAFGVLDGVDGKLARVKVETTHLGKWEHYVDHVLQYSWWLALGWAVGEANQLRHAWFFAVLVIAGDLLGKIVTRPVMAHTGKPSHDFSRFEQRLRLVGGRRNIYIFMMVFGLLLGFLARPLPRLDVGA